MHDVTRDTEECERRRRNKKREREKRKRDGGRDGWIVSEGDFHKGHPCVCVCIINRTAGKYRQNEGEYLFVCVCVCVIVTAPSYFSCLCCQTFFSNCSQIPFRLTRFFQMVVCDCVCL